MPNGFFVADSLSFFSICFSIFFFLSFFSVFFSLLLFLCFFFSVSFSLPLFLCFFFSISFSLLLSLCLFFSVSFSLLLFSLFLFLCFFLSIILLSAFPLIRSTKLPHYNLQTLTGSPLNQRYTFSNSIFALRTMASFVANATWGVRRVFFE